MQEQYVSQDTINSKPYCEPRSPHEITFSELRDDYPDPSLNPEERMILKETEKELKAIYRMKYGQRKKGN